MTTNGKKMNENHQSISKTDNITNLPENIRARKIREQKTIDAFEKALIELEEVLNSSKTLHKSIPEKTANGHEY